MFKRMENQVEQVEIALSGALERIASIEAQLKELEEGSIRKPVLYVDEETCLLSSEEADIKFIKRKLENV
jgi:hypothetical protein